MFVICIWYLNRIHDVCVNLRLVVKFGVIIYVYQLKKNRSDLFLKYKNYIVILLWSYLDFQFASLRSLKCFCTRTYNFQINQCKVMLDIKACPGQVK